MNKSAIIKLLIVRNMAVFSKGLGLIWLLWIVMTGFPLKSNAQNKPLFRITENNRQGFIDAQGKVIIKPVFRAAGDFSEGLASARIDGTHGFIDETGKFTIAPAYDYAESFIEGLAVVYKNGKPLYINRQGKKVFDCPCVKVSTFKNGNAQVYIASKKTGMINKQGRLVIDTVFVHLYQCGEGLGVVEGLNHNQGNGRRPKQEVGIIDMTGKFIAPYGQYDEILEMENGYLKARIPAEPWDTIDGYSAKTVILDKAGKVVLIRDHKDQPSIAGFPNCGLVPVYLQNKLMPAASQNESEEDKDYQGFINLKGDLVINNTAFRIVNGFSENRAFVRDRNRQYSLIDTKGRILANKAYDEVLVPGFKNGAAFVSKDEKWGIIDTNANFLVKPVFDGIAGPGMVGDYFFFEKRQTEEARGRLIGVATKEGKILIQPVMEEVSYAGFKNGLLACMVSGRLTYLNTAGKTVWQELKNRPFKNLNIDYMNRSGFYAYSRPDKRDLGGFAVSGNIPKKLTGKQNLPKNNLKMMVLPAEKDTLYGGYNGVKVIVANTTGKKVKFNAQDSRLYMKVQALKPDSSWADIEYIPSSWCGNSYHILTLDPKSYWAFVTPIYEGAIKTKLRIALNYIYANSKPDEYGDKKEITLYSNVYEGSVNPGQFWRKQEYYPRGLMDPYNE